MKQKKSEKVIEFEKQIAGTLVTILDLISIPCLLLLVVGVFLPICKVEIINENISLFDFSDASSVGLLMNLIIICLASLPGMIINKFRNDIIDGAKDKQKTSKYILIISIIQFVIVLLAVVLNLTVLSVSGLMEISKDFISAGSGTIMIYVVGIINSLIVLIKSILTIGVLNDKIQLRKILNIKK